MQNVRRIHTFATFYKVHESQLWFLLFLSQQLSFLPPCQLALGPACQFACPGFYWYTDQTKSHAMCSPLWMSCLGFLLNCLLGFFLFPTISWYGKWYIIFTLLSFCLLSLPHFLSLFSYSLRHTLYFGVVTRRIKNQVLIGYGTFVLKCSKVLFWVLTCNPDSLQFCFLQPSFSFVSLLWSSVTFHFDPKYLSTQVFSFLHLGLDPSPVHVVKEECTCAAPSPECLRENKKRYAQVFANDIQITEFLGSMFAIWKLNQLSAMSWRNTNIQRIEIQVFLQGSSF